ncbi:MAG: flagellar hook-length control protein FliK, partial [Thermomicrobiales bacterium]
LIGKELSSAELVLTPPSLGRVEVQLTVAGDQTSAVFVAATPAARDALEQALPKLRDFLADAGINLSQATVGGESSRDGGRQDGPPQRQSGGGDIAVSGRDGAAAAAVLRRVDGMVDTFA